ncbi:hypothetical protein ACFX1R_028393 [Malus domestica]
MERLLAHWYRISKQPNSGINLVEFLAEGDNGPVLSFDKIRAAPAELEDHRPLVKDPLEEINVGTADDPWLLFISALLPQRMKDEFRTLLMEFKDCFAWSYHEMPGLDRVLWSSMNYVLSPDLNLSVSHLVDSRPKHNSWGAG